MTGKNTRSAASKNDEIATKMGDLEDKFQQGLEKLRMEYKLSKPSEIEASGEAFEAKLKKFETDIRDSFELIKSDIKKLQMEMEAANKREEDRLRISNYNKIVIREMPEREGADLVDQVCGVINNSVKVTCQKSEIKCCYRLGKLSRESSGRKCRPVVVEFVCQWKRNEVFFSKKNLKGSGLVVCELLTVDRHRLFLKVRKEFEHNNVWTAKGTIVVSINGAKVYVNTEGDLLKICSK